MTPLYTIIVRGSAVIPHDNTYIPFLIGSLSLMILSVTICLEDAQDSAGIMFVYFWTVYFIASYYRQFAADSKIKIIS